jgi:hypothetical protein
MREPQMRRAQQRARAAAPPPGAGLAQVIAGAPLAAARAGAPRPGAAPVNAGTQIGRVRGQMARTQGRQQADQVRLVGEQRAQRAELAGRQSDEQAVVRRRSAADLSRQISNRVDQRGQRVRGRANARANMLPGGR